MANDILRNRWKREVSDVISFLFPLSSFLHIKIEKIICLLAAIWMATGLPAQTVRNITVSGSESYTDHISLQEDSNDKDLMVKFFFNEQANTLRVCLISYRSLFVFWDDVPYRQAFRGRRLRPDKLPYVVDFDPNDKFTVSKLFLATVPKPRDKWLFTRWISYEGLQPLPAEYKMTNDYLEQEFDIMGKRQTVVVSLGDVMLMDKLKSRPGKGSHYEIPFGRQLNLTYHVRLERNPCLGLDEDVAASAAALESIRKGYRSLRGKFSSGTVSSQAMLDVFHQMKALLQEQFPVKNAESPCPTVRQSWSDYNQYVDSIASFECRMVAPVVPSGGGGASEGVSPKVLLEKARQIDASVSRWLLSSDPVERRDIIQNCDNIINEVESLLDQKGARGAEQQKALTVYREAVRFYRNKCK